MSLKDLRFRLVERDVERSTGTCFSLKHLKTSLKRHPVEDRDQQKNILYLVGGGQTLDCLTMQHAGRETWDLSRRDFSPFTSSPAIGGAPGKR